jgi:putative oxidoreductase
MGKTDRIGSEDAGKLLLRVMIGGLLIFHGVSKAIHGIDWIKGGLAASHLPAFIAYGVYVGEILAPVLILVGVWTRLGGLIVAFDLIVAILMVRLPSLLAISKSGGWAMETDFFYLLGGLAIALMGPGRIRLGRGEGILA